MNINVSRMTKCAAVSDGVNGKLGFEFRKKDMFRAVVVMRECRGEYELQSNLLGGEGRVCGTH